MSEMEKDLVQGLKLMGAKLDEVLYIGAVLQTPRMRLEMLDWMISHEGATQVQRLNTVKRIASKYQREEA